MAFALVVYKVTASKPPLSLSLSQPPLSLLPASSRLPFSQGHVAVKVTSVAGEEKGLGRLREYLLIPSKPKYGFSVWIFCRKIRLQADSSRISMAPQLSSWKDRCQGKLRRRITIVFLVWFTCGHFSAPTATNAVERSTHLCLSNVNVYRRRCLCSKQ